MQDQLQKLPFVREIYALIFLHDIGLLDAKPVMNPVVRSSHLTFIIVSRPTNPIGHMRIIGRLIYLTTTIFDLS